MVEIPVKKPSGPAGRQMKKLSHEIGHIPEAAVLLGTHRQHPAAVRQGFAGTGIVQAVADAQQFLLLMGGQDPDPGKFRLVVPFKGCLLYTSPSPRD